MLDLHQNPAFWGIGIFLAVLLFSIWWTSPARVTRRRRNWLHRVSREIHPAYNRRERRALASRRWPR
jgi:hypothetical protein